jgi:hypothetical protein
MFLNEDLEEEIYMKQYEGFVLGKEIFCVQIGNITLWSKSITKDVVPKF